MEETKPSKGGICLVSKFLPSVLPDAIILTEDAQKGQQLARYRRLVCKVWISSWEDIPRVLQDVQFVDREVTDLLAAGEVQTGFRPTIQALKEGCWLDTFGAEPGDILELVERRFIIEDSAPVKDVTYMPTVVEQLCRDFQNLPCVNIEEEGEGVGLGLGGGKEEEEEGGLGLGQGQGQGQGQGMPHPNPNPNPNPNSRRCLEMVILRSMGLRSGMVEQSASDDSCNSATALSVENILEVRRQEMRDVTRDLHDALGRLEAAAVAELERVENELEANKANISREDRAKSLRAMAELELKIDQITKRKEAVRSAEDVIVQWKARNADRHTFDLTAEAEENMSVVTTQEADCRLTAVMVLDRYLVVHNRKVKLLQASDALDSSDGADGDGVVDGDDVVDDVVDGGGGGGGGGGVQGVYGCDPHDHGDEEDDKMERVRVKDSAENGQPFGHGGGSAPPLPLVAVEISHDGFAEHTLDCIHTEADREADRGVQVNGVAVEVEMYGLMGMEEDESVSSSNNSNNSSSSNNNNSSSNNNNKNNNNNNNNSNNNSNNKYPGHDDGMPMLTDVNVAEIPMCDDHAPARDATTASASLTSSSSSSSSSSSPPSVVLSGPEEDIRTSVVTTTIVAAGRDGGATITAGAVATSIPQGYAKEGAEALLPLPLVKEETRGTAEADCHLNRTGSGEARRHRNPASAEADRGAGGGRYADIEMGDDGADSSESTSDEEVTIKALVEHKEKRHSLSSEASASSLPATASALLLSSVLPSTDTLSSSSSATATAAATATKAAATATKAAAAAAAAGSASISRRGRARGGGAGAKEEGVTLAGKRGGGDDDDDDDDGGGVVEEEDSSEGEAQLEFDKDGHYVGSREQKPVQKRDKEDAGGDGDGSDNDDDEDDDGDGGDGDGSGVDEDENDGGSGDGSHNDDDDDDDDDDTSFHGDDDTSSASDHDDDDGDSDGGGGGAGGGGGGGGRRKSGALPDKQASSTSLLSLAEPKGSGRAGVRVSASKQFTGTLYQSSSMAKSAIDHMLTGTTTTAPAAPLSGAAATSSPALDSLSSSSSSSPASPSLSKKAFSKSYDQTAYHAAGQKQTNRTHDDSNEHKKEGSGSRSRTGDSKPTSGGSGGRDAMDVECLPVAKGRALSMSEETEKNGGVSNDDGSGGSGGGGGGGKGAKRVLQRSSNGSNGSSDVIAAGSIEVRAAKIQRTETGSTPPSESATTTSSSSSSSSSLSPSVSLPPSTTSSKDKAINSVDVRAGDQTKRAAPAQGKGAVDPMLALRKRAKVGKTKRAALTSTSAAAPARSSPSSVLASSPTPTPVVAKMVVLGKKGNGKRAGEDDDDDGDDDAVGGSRNKDAKTGVDDVWMEEKEDGKDDDGDDGGGYARGDVKLMDSAGGRKASDATGAQKMSGTGKKKVPQQQQRSTKGKVKRKADSADADHRMINPPADAPPPLKIIRKRSRQNINEESDDDEEKGKADGITTTTTTASVKKKSSVSTTTTSSSSITTTTPIMKKKKPNTNSSSSSTNTITSSSIITTPIIKKKSNTNSSSSTNTNTGSTNTNTSSSTTKSTKAAGATTGESIDGTGNGGKVKDKNGTAGKGTSRDSDNSKDGVPSGKLSIKSSSPIKKKGSAGAGDSTSSAGGGAISKKGGNEAGKDESVKEKDRVGSGAGVASVSKKKKGEDDASIRTKKKGEDEGDGDLIKDKKQQRKSGEEASSVNVKAKKVDRVAGKDESGKKKDRVESGAGAASISRKKGEDDGDGTLITDKKQQRKSGEEAASVSVKAKKVDSRSDEQRSVGPSNKEADSGTRRSRSPDGSDNKGHGKDKKEKAKKHGSLKGELSVNVRSESGETYAPTASPSSRLSALSSAASPRLQRERSNNGSRSRSRDRGDRGRQISTARLSSSPRMKHGGNDRNDVHSRGTYGEELSQHGRGAWGRGDSREYSRDSREYSNNSQYRGHYERDSRDRSSGRASDDDRSSRQSDRERGRERQGERERERLSPRQIDSRHRDTTSLKAKGRDLADDRDRRGSRERGGDNVSSSRDGGGGGGGGNIARQRSSDSNDNSSSRNNSNNDNKNITTYKGKSSDSTREEGNKEVDHAGKSSTSSTARGPKLSTSNSSQPTRAAEVTPKCYPLDSAAASPYSPPASLARTVTNDLDFAAVEAAADRERDGSGAKRTLSLSQYHSAQPKFEFSEGSQFRISSASSPVYSPPSASSSPAYLASSPASSPPYLGQSSTSPSYSLPPSESRTADGRVIMSYSLPSDLVAGPLAPPAFEREHSDPGAMRAGFPPARPLLSSSLSMPVLASASRVRAGAGETAFLGPRQQQRSLAGVPAAANVRAKEGWSALSGGAGTVKVQRIAIGQEPDLVEKLKKDKK